MVSLTILLHSQPNRTRLHARHARTDTHTHAHARACRHAHTGYIASIAYSPWLEMTQEFTSRAFFPERSFKTGSLLGAASCRVHCLHLRPFIMQYIPCPLPPRNGDALCVTLHLGLWAQLITNFRLVLVTNLIFLIHSLLLPLPLSLSLASIAPTTFDMAKTDPECIAKKKTKEKDFKASF